MPDNEKTEFEIVLTEKLASDVRELNLARAYGVDVADVRAVDAAMEKNRQMEETANTANNIKWGQRVSFLGQQGAQFLDPFASAQEQTMDLERRLGGMGGAAVGSMAGQLLGTGASEVWAQVGREVSEAIVTALQREERFAIGRARGDIEGIITPLARMGMPESALKELAAAIAPFAGAAAGREARAKAIAADTHIETGLTLGDTAAALQMKEEQLKATLQQRARFYTSPGDKK